MATNAPKLGSSEERGSGWLFTLPPFWQAPRFRERLIVESWNRSRRHLSISFWKRSRLPLLEPLLENIECWPVELVAAGGLQLQLSLIPDRPNHRYTPPVSTLLSGARGLKRRPLAPPPIPAYANLPKEALGCVSIFLILESL